jgi:hypothetical protein
MGKSPSTLVFVLFTKNRMGSFEFIVVTFKSFQKYLRLNSKSRCSIVELLDYKHFYDKFGGDNISVFQVHRIQHQHIVIY